MSDEGFQHEPNNNYHVPQQTRREKLREITTPSPATTSLRLLNNYDSSKNSRLLLSSTSYNNNNNNNNNLHQPLLHHLKQDEYSTNFMAFVGLGTSTFLPSSSSSSSFSSSQLLFDLSQSSVSTLNQTIGAQEVDIHSSSINNPFLCPSQITQNLRDFDPSFDNGNNHGVMSFSKQLPFSFAAPQQMVPTGGQGQGLSLSLSSSHCRNPSDALRAGVFDEKGVGSYVVRGVPGGGPIARSSVPTGPFTGYAAILKGSRYLKPAQQLLDEFCDMGRGFYAGRNGGESPVGRELESLNESAAVDDCPTGSSSGGERRKINAALVSLLNEVYRRYKQYYQQLQTVITSFESVAGLGTAAPYISLAIKAMSKHFGCLKNSITDQLHFTSKVISEECLSKEENQSFGLVDQGVWHQKVPHNLRILEQPHVWRPQRGLPERAVAVLRAWLFEHFLHPYPTDTDKQMLAKQTGLSRNQVSNWFINARVRLWKPMVEEIHSLEMRQAEKASSDGENNNGNRQCKLQPAAPVLPTNKKPQDTTTRKSQDPPLKRNRNELAQLPNNCNEYLVNKSYTIVSHHGGVGVNLASGNGGISLTLGLRQNNGSGLSEPLPLRVAHFGLEENENPYMMGGFDSENQQRDIGGQLLRGFVG